jgi:Holliday junction resolvase
LDVGTFQRLLKIRDKFGPGIFGKITQKLLALAFYEAHFDHVVEREVQGVDIDVSAGDDKRFALEVKTTGGESVPISRENIDALKDRAKDGYKPLIAALRMQMFEDWMFAGFPLRRLEPGFIQFTKLRSYRNRELENLICPAFEQVVNQHFGSVLTKGEYYLNELLAQKRESQNQKERKISSL